MPSTIAGTAKRRLNGTVASDGSADALSLGRSPSLEGMPAG